MPDQVSFAKGSTKPTSGITTGRLYVVDSSTTDKSDLYLGKDATHLIQIGATVAQGAKADSSVQSVKVGNTSYSPSSGVVSLPAYPTTLPASDVYAWAKAANKPSYTFSEITSRGEAYLVWGGRQIQGGIGPLGMSISAEHSANRIALIPGAALTFEYSSDGGTTWTDYGFSDGNKTAFCTSSHNVPVGRPNSSTDLVANQSMTRITLTAQNGTTGYVYTDPVKMLVRVSTATALSMKVETRTGTNYKSDGAWGNYGTYNVSGWSGWNDIPFILGTLGGGTTQTSNFWQLRLTFTCTSVNPSYPKTADILAIRIYGPNAWTIPSTMANTGHLYTYDMGGNATFPAVVSATILREGSTKLSDKYLALTGGTLSLANADSFKLKRTNASGGAFVTYYNLNQDTNYWMVGMDGLTTNPFNFYYNGSVKASLSKEGNLNTYGYLSEGGTALANKYGRLASANTWTGNNTFSGALSATDGVSLSADSGDVAFSVSLRGIDLSSRYGVNIFASERGYISAAEPIRYDAGVVPSNNKDLTTKSYVDNKFVDKTSNQTSIAGQKSWTGNQIVTGSVTHTISNATGYATRYYDAQYRYSSGDLNSSTSIQRSASSVSTSASSGRTISSTGLSDNSSADISISSGYTTSTTTMAAPSIYLHTYAAGSASSSSPYVYHDGWIVLYSGNSNSNRHFSVRHELDASETQNVLKYDAEGRFSLDYDYMWGEETTHMEIVPQNGDYYIGDPNNYGMVSISDIVNAITCFRGDTTYVTMYDGSKKLISEVKEGDSVLGYDVNKKDYCEAIVIKNIKTGEQMGYNCYVMDDGTTIDIHGDDNFIANVKDKWYCDSDGDYLGIYSMTKNLMKFHDTGDDSHRIIKETGNLDNTTCVIHSFWTPCAEMTPRYSLYTSNGTMFVNGLLHAQSPRDTINIFRKRRFTLPDNIKEVFDEISLDMSARDEALPNDRISNPEKAENIAKLNEAKVKIAVYKKKLADTDYKAMKYAEGALTEEEWLPVKEDRASWRDTVNQMEEIVAEYQPIVEEENPEMFEHDWQYKNSKWKYRQSIFDAHLEDFREWQESVKEERQKRIEESKERSRLRAEEIKANKSPQKNEDK